MCAPKVSDGSRILAYGMPHQISHMQSNMCDVVNLRYPFKICVMKYIGKQKNVCGNNASKFSYPMANFLYHKSMCDEVYRKTNGSNAVKVSLQEMMKSNIS